MNLIARWCWCASCAHSGNGIQMWINKFDALHLPKRPMGITRNAVFFQLVYNEFASMLNAKNDILLVCCVCVCFIGSHRLHFKHFQQTNHCVPNKHRIMVLSPQLNNFPFLMPHASCIMICNSSNNARKKPLDDAKEQQISIFNKNEPKIIICAC